MIIGYQSRIIDYACLIPNLQQGLDAIQKANELPVGRYSFDGGYFLIQEGVTKPFDRNGFEAHRQYIDVQLVIGGLEEIAWEDIHQLSTVTAYDVTIDKEKLGGSTQHHLLISQGMFWVAFPSDGHIACAHSETPTPYRKVVLKLPVIHGG